MCSGMVLRIFLRVIEQSLQAHCPGAAQMDKNTLHIGAVAFIRRFGSGLNEHVHFHVCVVDGVFESTAPGVIFHPASGIDAAAVAQVQADLRRRILRAFVGHGLIERVDAKEMLAYQHSGFSVDAGVCIEAHDRAALERLLRYCARPPFAMDRLRKAGNDLVYRCAKQHSEPTGDKRGAKVDELTLTPTAKIYEVFPLLCPMCGGQMRLIAFITEGAQIRKILDHIGVDSEPPHIAPARGPPLWEDCGDAQMGEGVEVEPDWDLAAQPAPDYEGRPARQLVSGPIGNFDSLRVDAACATDPKQFCDQGSDQSSGSAVQASGTGGVLTRPTHSILGFIRLNFLSVVTRTLHSGPAAVTRVLFSYQASALGCDGDVGRPTPIRVGRSTVRNAGHKETVAARSGETDPVWAEKLVGCASVVLQPLRPRAKNHRPGRRISVRTSQRLRQFRPAPQLQK